MLSGAVTVAEFIVFIPTIARPRAGAQRDRWTRPFWLGVLMQWIGLSWWVSVAQQASSAAVPAATLLQVAGDLAILYAAKVLLGLPRAER